nr:RNA-directed DNA polymerase, eukaryota, nucleotide-binding alpha-beta plait domain protein [Tanacetum cinerariifolium]
AAGYRHVKVLEFFDCPGPRQGVEDLKELLHKLEDKQPEEKTNTDCLVKEQEKEYQTRWKIKTGNVLDSCNQRSTQQYKKSEVAKHLGVAGIQQQNGLVDETNVTFFAKEYKKTFIGSGVGDHTFEVEPQENVDQGAGLQEVQTQDLIYYHLARDREQHLACELFGYREDINEAAFAVVVVEKIYAHESPTFNNTVASTVVGNAVTTAMAINGSIHQVLQQKLVQTLLEGHFILSLKGSLSRDCDVEKNDIRTLFVDFDYAMGRSITRYGFMILGCAGSLKANLQDMKALSTTEAGYMTFIEAWKKKIWLKGLLTESRYELRLVAGIAIGALVKGGSRSEVPAQVEVAAYRECNVYGTVVDVFIPFKKSKASKRFAFVRFIKVFNLDRLVKNLCTIWIGRHHLYANQPNGFAGSYATAVNGAPTSANPGSLISPSPALVLDDACIIERDFSKYAMGEAKDFNYIPNLQTLLNDKESFKIIVKGKVCMVRAKELFTWNPNFLAHKETVYSSDDESVHGEKHKAVQSHLSEEDAGDYNASDVDGVSETIFDENSASPKNYSGDLGKQHSDDPFELYDSLKKKKSGVEIREPSPSLSHLLVLHRWVLRQ